jgi:cystinosin
MAISMQGWRDISATVGWLYFLAWSLSFYPQVWLNYSLKSVAGFSLEYALLNPSGYFFYSCYNVGGSVDPYLGTGIVEIQDLIFAVHGLALSNVCFVQSLIYESGTQKETNRFVVAFLVFLWLCVITTYLFEVFDHPIYDLNWDTFLVMGYAKAAITFVKYVPQVFLNYRRKSTEGLSMLNIMLDLAGGLLSFL